MSETIYVVFEADWSDYKVEAAYRDRAAAEADIARRNEDALMDTEWYVHEVELL